MLINLEAGEGMTVVRVEQGVLKGVCYGDIYIAFKGIPYAKPPLGELRFKAPEPPEPWEGVRDASQHGPVCPQYNERMDRLDPGDEDCLYLNVYTKALTPTNPLPVMVWIHGGGFYTGSGNSDFYGPEFIMAHDVVLVTINYRLEVLGFLSLDTEDVPGNAGLKDQAFALKWVKKNIAAFGGNPDNVTIFGCSAGAASVSCHLISNYSKGLFNKAICQSGICLNEWSYNLYVRERAFQLGKLLGIDTDDPKELAQFLRSVPVLSLVNVQLPALDIKHHDLTDSILFGPVVEKAGLDVNKFIADLPTELVKLGKIANVPIILGYTSGEGIEIGRKLPYIADYLGKIGAVLPRELKLKWPIEKIENVDKQIRKHYGLSNEITNEQLQEVVDLETDKLFLYNMIRYARYHCHHATENVFLYKFVAETERNYTKRYYKMDSVKGVCHADELTYLFNVSCLDIALTDESRDIIKRFVQLWTNFASTGKPTSESEEWKPFTETERNCYIIGMEMKCSQDENKDILFWENVYEETKLDT